MDNKDAKIVRLESTIKLHESKIANLEKEQLANKKMYVASTKELNKLKIELQRLITRMNSNEADLRYLNSKR